MAKPHGLRGVPTGDFLIARVTWMPWIRRTRGLVLLSLLCSVGCGGDGQGLDENGRPVGSESASTGPLTADLQSIQDNIFTPICSRCHSGASAPEGLRLDAADSYGLLVGIPSAEDPGISRVTPGNPDNSYLIRKLEGGPGIVGVQMPFGGPYLPQASIDVIRQWITNGAQNTQAMTAAADMHAFAVTSTSPMNGTTVTQPLSQLLVIFNHDIDASLVNETTITVETVPQNGGAVPLFSAQLVPANASVMLLKARDGLSAGTYRVTLRGTGPAALADMNAAILGTDYSFTFTVDAAR
jgi:hypothetical protein